MQPDGCTIEVRGLRKSFGAQKVLDGIDLAVKSGETLAVLGRSGTGKSVLLKLLIGLQPPDSGTIQICGQELSSLEIGQLNEIRKKIGFLFQQAALYDSLTVEENVAFPLVRHGAMEEAERRDKVRELLAAVGLENETGKLPSEISGGMQKRVGLARALALDPQILLFDEPTAGLDPVTAEEIGELIKELKGKRNTSSVVVTHDIRGARMFSERLALIDDGRVLAEGSFEELQKSGNEFVARFVGSGG
jgi:phospholipid/cholesterol/gamma-HCH transport system ATP-binding protein